MPVVRIPLVGSLTSRDAGNTTAYGASQKDQYFENASFQLVKNPLSGKGTAWVSGRNDFAVSAVPTGPASGNGTAIRYWRGHSTPGTDHVVTAFGSTNSTLYDGNTSLGAITGLCIFMSETNVSGTATILFVSNANLAYYFSEGGSLTEVTDVDFPPKQTPALRITGNFVHMDGIPFIMTTNGQLWHAEPNSVTNWAATANIAAQEYPDPGVGLARYRNYIVALSRNSMEFFQNTGNAAGAVLSRVQNLATQVGCISERAILQYEDTIVWVGGSNSPGVWMLDGGQPKKISSQEIDYMLEGAVYNSVRLNVVTSWGVPHIALAVNASGAGSTDQYLFNPATGFWSLWTLGNALTQSDCPGTASSGCFYVGQDQVTYLSNSANVVPATIQTALLDFDTIHYKTQSRLRLIGDRATQASEITVSWSDDDYQTFSSGRIIDMQDDNPEIYRCGRFRRRGFRLTGIGEAAADRLQRIEAIELTYEVAVK